MAKVGDFAREEIRAALFGLSGATARMAAQDLAARLNISMGHVYRIAAEHRRTTRKTRKDAGQMRATVPDEIALFMEALTRDGDLAAETVLFATARHFGLAEDFMSVTTYNAWLRRRRIGRQDLKKDLTPYRSFEAAQANDLHHFDTTVAEAFYANDDGSIGNEPRSERYKNKPGNRKPRLHLYSIIDDHSRVLFARFYFSENTYNLLDFVYRAWAQKEDKRFPFYGMPAAIYADCGAAQMSHKFTYALEKLGVRRIDSLPSHATRFGSRKHGKVERTFGEGLLGEFMKLTLLYRFGSIEEMNSTLWEWLIHLNNRSHSATKEKRFARWIRSVGMPRAMPSEEMFKLLHWDRSERVVSRNLQISLNGQIYQLPYKRPFINWVDARVEVYVYPGKAESIMVVYDHYEEEIPRLAPVVDLAEQYRAVPETDQAKRIAQGEQQDLNTVNWPELWKTDLPYLPKKGKAFDDTRITDTARIVVDDDGNKRSSFVGKRYLNKYQVVPELVEAGLMALGDDGKYTEASLQLRDLLMAGRDTVSDDELDDFIGKREKERQAKYGGEND